MISAGGGSHLKHEDKKALCCRSRVTFADGQAVRSGSWALGTAPQEVRRCIQVSGIRWLPEAGQAASRTPHC